MIDYAGQTFGKLHVIKRVGTRDGQPLWECMCGCGNKCEATSHDFRNGKKNCGCVPGRKKDITGQKFGKLTAVRFIESDVPNEVLWLCKCDCGNEIIKTARQLREGTYPLCKECRKTRKVHVNRKNQGKSGTRLYSIWSGMKRRCYDNRADSYKNYGQRGIKVCDEWMEFENFEKWANLSGYSNDLSLDRIDNDGNYEPSNCRWADDETQRNNTRRNAYYTYNGETFSLAQWSRRTGISRDALKGRIRKQGWTFEKAITTPMRKKIKKDEILSKQIS